MAIMPSLIETGYKSMAPAFQDVGPADLHVIAIPSFYPSSFGPADGIFFQDQVRGLQKLGVKVGVLYPERRSVRTFGKGSVLASRFQTESYEEEGVPTLRVHGWNIPKTRAGDTWQLRATLRLMQTYIDRFGVPDVCHAFNALWGGVAANEMKRVWKIPYVVTEESTDYITGAIRAVDQEPARQAYSGAAAVISVSDDLKRHISPYAKDKEFFLAPNMVDTEYFCLPPSKRLKVPFRFLVVAALTGRKGIDLLLRAFAQAFGSNANVLLEIGGDGPERLPLEKLALELGIANRVRFLGFVSREQVREAMWRANAFVLPSHVETFGVVLIESLATGIPVIATRSGGPEMIVTPEVGYLIAKGQVSVLRETLEKTLQHHARFGEGQVRQYAINTFGNRAVSEQLVSIYKLVLGTYGQRDQSSGHKLESRAASAEATGSVTC